MPGRWRTGKTVVLTISGRLSGTYQSATIAAEDFAGKVFVIDSYNATIGEGILVKYALLLRSGIISSQRNCRNLKASKEQIHTLGVPGYAGIFEKRRPHLRRHRILGGAMAIKPVVAYRKVRSSCSARHAAPKRE